MKYGFAQISTNLDLAISSEVRVMLMLPKRLPDRGKWRTQKMLERCETNDGSTMIHNPNINIKCGEIICHPRRQECPYSKYHCNETVNDDQKKFRPESRIAFATSPVVCCESK